MLMSMKRDARKLQPIVQEELRRRAVAAIHGGMRQVEAAEVFGVARKTVWQWLTAYTPSGDSSLAARKRGPKGGGGKLKGWQAAAICNLIRDHHPEQLKLPFVLWTSEAIQRLIARRFGVKLSARSVRRHTTGWGGTPRGGRLRYGPGQATVSGQTSFRRLPIEVTWRSWCSRGILRRGCLFGFCVDWSSIPSERFF